ncbi:MAG: HD domain-containing protein [Dehalococcoidia bacterium]
MLSNRNLFLGGRYNSFLPEVQAFLSSRNIEAYLVGGCVRDGLRGIITSDIDMAIGCDAVKTARQIADNLNGRFVLLDELHQVARTVLIDGEDRYNLDFAPLRGSIEEDLGKRDFTINAMAVRVGELHEGWNEAELIDPLDGIGDMEKRLIRACGDPVFIDDPVRMLRAFRFAAELGFVIDAGTETLVYQQRSLLTQVSGERIREELGHILETGKTAETLGNMDRLGILEVLFPDLANCKGVEQPKEHYWDVFDHSIETVAAVERLLAALNSDGDLLNSFIFSHEMAVHFRERAGGALSRGALVKLAALLHDIAKPQTREFDPNHGKIRFLGHAQRGAGIADSILQRLRFSSHERGIVSRMIDQHLRPGHLSNAPELPTKRAIYRYFRDTGEVGIDTLLLSLADHLATRGPAFEMEGWQEHLEVTRYMLTKRFEDEAVVSPPKLIDGHVLMERFGLAPGPEIGEILEAVREARASGEIETQEEALDFARKELERKYANQR